MKIWNGNFCGAFELRFTYGWASGAIRIFNGRYCGSVGCLVSKFNHSSSETIQKLMSEAIKHLTWQLILMCRNRKYLISQQSRLIWCCHSFFSIKRHLSLNNSHLLFQVVTGATDGIGKQYAKSVSEISSLSGSLFIQFRCLTVINNNFSITRERRKKYGNAALWLDGRKTKL